MLIQQDLMIHSVALVFYKFCLFLNLNFEVFNLNLGFQPQPQRILEVGRNLHHYKLRPPFWASYFNGARSLRSAERAPGSDSELRDFS